MAAAKPQFRVISDPRAHHIMRLRRIIKAGVAAGLLAGLVMLIIEMIYTDFCGLGMWAPLQWIASGVLGGLALHQVDARVIASGLAIHSAVTAFWGFFFALFIHRSDSTRHAVGWGIPWGMGVWAFMTYVILPLENTTMLTQVKTMPIAWLMFHMIYGACLAMTPWLMRRFARRPTRPVLVTW